MVGSYSHGVAKSWTRLSDFIHSVISDVEHLVEMLSTPAGHLYIFFAKMSIQVLCPFLIGFLPLNCMSSLHSLDVNPLSGIYVCVCSVAQVCPTLCNPVDCSLLGSSIHDVFQARILEQVAISYSRGSFQPRDQACVSCTSCIGRWILYHCVTWEALSDV